MNDAEMNKVLLIILAILLPPLAVGLKEGVTTQFWINLLLTFFLLWVGGVIHALVIVLR